jgi:RND family efflux transporter MFP subunit
LATSSGPPVSVLTVQSTVRASTTLTASGYVAAQDLITIGTTVSGRVMKVLVENGQRVKRGQPLVQLDDSELKAEAHLAQAQLHDAQQTAERYRKLVKAEAATVVDYEKSLGQVQVARAAVGVIYSRLKQMQIVASVDGTVIETLTHPGEVLSPVAGSTVGVVKMADLSHLVVETDLNEADITLVQRGDHAEVSVESFPDKIFSGTVVELAGQADRTKGTLTVKVQLSDPVLRPGLSAKVRFQGRSAPTPRLLIPKAAVVSGAVWVVDGKSVVHRRQVTTRSAGPDIVEVADGLAAGERIVGAGGPPLSDGDRLPGS